jgi:hypothetical protein
MVIADDTPILRHGIAAPVDAGEFPKADTRHASLLVMHGTKGNRFHNIARLQRAIESCKDLATWVYENYEQAAATKFLADADFVLVAYAQAHNHTVVTHETPGYGFDVKIPNACKWMEVPVVSPFQMLANEKVKLILSK